MKQSQDSHFAFAYKAKLKSEFEGENFISLVPHAQEYSEWFTCNPEALFLQLKQGNIELNLMQMLSLMGWESDVWDGHAGQIAMANWWRSVLTLERRGDEVPKRMMVLRSVLADRERHPGPEPVIRIMRKHLKSILQNEVFQPEETTVIQALLEQNASKLALYAWQNLESVQAILTRQRLPPHLPLMHEANRYWLTTWMNGTDAQRNLTISSLKVLLNHSELAIQLEYAHTILENDTVYNNIMQHQEVLVSYAEVVSALSIWNRRPEFKKQLSDELLRRLGNWLGSGNYQTLKKILYEIVHYEAQYASTDEDERLRIIRTSKNRYFFWEHYQHLFREAWLLVSEKIYDDYAVCRKVDNIKKVRGLTYPKILIRLGDYFIIQTFVQVGLGVDLVMTSDVKTVEYRLSQNELTEGDLDELSFCLIHDHVFLWQEALAHTLNLHFAIQKKNHQKIIGNVRDDKKQKVRNEQLKYWRKSTRQRYGDEAVSRFALSLEEVELSDRVNF